ncbi:hypothetical protein PPL_11013 [Heterostelium album PN500]|uniref:Uncharacterized protein n=1 Tax=Heterostelium pallidum (strain ATCC 26659 / Pp 5 / PN500) TaxID=670386 RepID=D3BSP4_HETP5|nr:hypothetical protein PPL_11013 [Heterostelium album PN500]EFA75509.1 hypothetical protein PPL_11013 [Heterostelium album PN500]|eukprot:XP_020427643.1 hypothetical protein PPL_11013 [Heterostelium album PN500]
MNPVDIEKTTTTTGEHKLDRDHHRCRRRRITIKKKSKEKGSGMCKAGFSGDEAPQPIFQSIVGSFQSPSHFLQEDNFDGKWIKEKGASKSNLEKEYEFPDG